jgi:hypothetical protein
VVVAGCGKQAADPPKATVPVAQPVPPGQPVLGFTECSPAMLRELPTGELMVSILGVGYDSFGRVVTFLEELHRSGPAASAKVAVVHDPSGSCPAMKYTVETEGRQLASSTEADFKIAGFDGYFGFTANEIGGIVVVGQLEGGLETSLSYDSFGRRKLARQTFTYAGRRYLVTYSEVKFDGFGRLSAYTAVLQPVPGK